jgi:hypothetical protein
MLPNCSKYYWARLGRSFVTLDHIASKPRDSLFVPRRWVEQRWRAQLHLISPGVGRSWQGLKELARVLSAVPLKPSPMVCYMRSGQQRAASSLWREHSQTGQANWNMLSSARLLSAAVRLILSREIRTCATCSLFELIAAGSVSRITPGYLTSC